MAVIITHKKEATYPDQPDAEINKAEWNDEHNFTGTIPAANLEAAGSDTEVQFNDDGALGADANFLWNKTNKELQLTGNSESFSIGNPTGSITVTDAGASGFAPYGGDSVTHQFKIYAYRDVSSVRLYSTTPITGSIYLETGENYRELNFQFTAVANASGYILVWDGGGFGYYPYYKDIGNSVNYDDDGQVAYTTTVGFVDYAPPNGNSIALNLAPLWVGKTLDLATKNVEILKYGTEENVLKWDAVSQRLKLATSADALSTLNANIIADNLTAASATITSLAGTHSTGTVASAVNVLAAASGATGSYHDALVAVTVTGGSAMRSISNSTLRLNPSRKTITMNTGNVELGQGVSGTMLSIQAASAYAAIAMKAGSSGGLHFFQIINSSDVVRALFRDDGVAIFGSTSYSNYGRATFIDDGFAGSPFAGQLSSLCYYSQDDESIYGWAVGNRTYDTGWQKANVVCVALNAGGGYMGTPDNTPLSFRTNNIDRLTFTGAGVATFSGNVVASARILGFQGTDVASANNLVLGNGNVFEITGTTQINLISNLSWQNGSQVTLLFTATPTVKHNQATSGTNIRILLAGAVDFVATAGDTLTLVLSEIGGTQAWREVSRAVI